MARQTAADTPTRTGLLGFVCVATISLVAFVPTVASIAIPSMAAHFGGRTDARFFAQMVLAAAAVTQMIGAPVMGAVADRIGRKVSLLACILLYLVSGASVLVIESATGLIVSRLMIGFAAGGLWTIALAIIGDYFDHEARERLLGYVSATLSFLAAGTMVTGGMLIDAFGWRAPFALHLLGLPIFLMVWILLPSSRAQVPFAHAEQVAMPARGWGFAALLPAAPTFVLLTIYMIGSQTAYNEVGLVLNDRGFTHAAFQGTVIGLAPLLGAITAGSYGFMRHRLAPERVLMISALCFGTGILFIAFAPSALMITAGCLIMGIGMGMFEPPLCSIILDRTDRSVHALAMGLNVCFLNMGTFLHPMLVRGMLQFVDLQEAIGMLGLMMFMACLYLALVGRRPAAVPAVVTDR